MSEITVIVADDHAAYREGLCRLLEDEEGLRVIASTADGEEVLRLAQELAPDVIIMDVAMPRLDGIEAAKRIKGLCPGTAILMVSAYDYESYLLASLEAGASGYLLKEDSFSELARAIHSVHSGKAVFELEAVKRALDSLKADGGRGRGGPRGMSPREIEVLEQVARGIGNKEVSRELGISERTVQTHLRNIFRKLEVNSRTQAVLRASQGGWLTFDDGARGERT